MDFDRQKVLDQVKAFISKEEAHARDVLNEAQREALADEENFLVRYGDDWIKFANVVRQKSDLGKAITWDDVPKGLRHAALGVLNFYDDKKHNIGTYESPHLHNARAMLARLEATVDKTFSDYALAALGVNVTALFQGDYFVTPVPRVVRPDIEQMLKNLLEAIGGSMGSQSKPSASRTLGGTTGMVNTSPGDARVVVGNEIPWNHGEYKERA